MSGNNRAAVIYIAAGAPPIMCTVADISEGGAGLTFVSIAASPIPSNWKSRARWKSVRARLRGKRNRTEWVSRLIRRRRP